MRCFQKATWALVFLIRFKRKTLMSFGERKVTAAAAIADIYDGLPVSIEKIMRNCAESETNTFGTARSIQDGKKMKELLNDISAAAKGAFDTPKRESVIDEKHPEVIFRSSHRTVLLEQLLISWSRRFIFRKRS